MQNEIRALTGVDLRVTSATPLDTLGSAGFTADNRQFSYVHAGSTAITAGQLVCTPAVIANHQGVILTTGSPRSVGSTQIVVTLGNTAATGDQYADGYVTVVSGTGNGTSYRIKGNTATAANGAMTVNLYNQEPLVKALDGTSTLNFTDSAYDGVVATASAAHAVGVATCDIPASSYGWVQTYGLCSVLIKGSIAKGVSVIQSTSQAGAVANGAGNSAILGNTLEACTDGQTNSVWLQIT